MLWFSRQKNVYVVIFECACMLWFSRQKNVFVVNFDRYVKIRGWIRHFSSLKPRNPVTLNVLVKKIEKALQLLTLLPRRHPSKTRRQIWHILFFENLKKHRNLCNLVTLGMSMKIHEQKPSVTPVTSETLKPWINFENLYKHRNLRNLVTLVTLVTHVTFVTLYPL